MLKKIVILGPESTGKSTLCQRLSAYYQTSWCPEFAREYLEKNGTAYSFDDLLLIAKGQLELEEKHSLSFQKNEADNHRGAAKSLLFIDTDQYVMKVWCEYVFNQCHTWILNRIVERPYDLYLLCNIDLPWIKDELREYPDEKPRHELYHMYKDLMQNQHVPWTEISGTYEERFQKSKMAVDKHFF